MSPRPKKVARFASPTGPSPSPSLSKKACTKRQTAYAPKPNASAISSASPNGSFASRAKAPSRLVAAPPSPSASFPARTPTIPNDTPLAASPIRASALTHVLFADARAFADRSPSSVLVIVVLSYPARPNRSGPERETGPLNRPVSRCGRSGRSLPDQPPPLLLPPELPGSQSLSTVASYPLPPPELHLCSWPPIAGPVNAPAIRVANSTASSLRPLGCIPPPPDLWDIDATCRSSGVPRTQ